MTITVTMLATRAGRTKTKTVEVPPSRHIFIVGTELCETEIRQHGKPDRLAFYVSVQHTHEPQPKRIAIHEII